MPTGLDPQDKFGMSRQCSPLDSLYPNGPHDGRRHERATVAPCLELNRHKAPWSPQPEPACAVDVCNDGLSKSQRTVRCEGTCEVQRCPMPHGRDDAKSALDRRLSATTGVKAMSGATETRCNKSAECAGQFALLDLSGHRWSQANQQTHDAKERARYNGAI